MDEEPDRWRQATVEQGIGECWVSDNGQGIAAELIDKVFDKGESGGENGTGSGLGLGLGLAIVKAFVEAQGGRVTVESVMGQGSKLHFTIPVQATPVA